VTDAAARWVWSKVVRDVCRQTSYSIWWEACEVADDADLAAIYPGLRDERFAWAIAVDGSPMPGGVPGSSAPRY
jgi:hypothetical protein